MRDLLDLRGGESVLVVGLGNRAMTPDAVGPLSAGGILVTRHLRQQLPQIFAGVRPVSALVPGVLGTTGVESAEIVQSVVEATRPDRVVVVDALAAGSADRLCRVIQVTDAGIVPGSGVGNSRAAFSAETLGVPVVAGERISEITTAESGGSVSLPLGAYILKCESVPEGYSPNREKPARALRIEGWTYPVTVSIPDYADPAKGGEPFPCPGRWGRDP